MKVQVLPDSSAMSRKAAEMFSNFSNQYIEEKGRMAVAVSGGSTPIKLYSLLGSGNYKKQIDWRNMHFFLVDERFVPHDHSDSNYSVLRENLLSKIPIPPENIHTVRTELSSTPVAAAAYEEEIKDFFRVSGYGLPEFDLVILGIGEDGHTASLFPGSESLNEKNRLAIPVNDQAHNFPRITLTLPVINKAKNIIFLVSGERKAMIVKRVIENRDTSLPASLVHQEQGNLFFLLDKEAGLLLELPAELSF